MVNMICPVKFTVNKYAYTFCVTYMVDDITHFFNLMCIFIFYSKAMKDYVGFLKFIVSLLA